jgi:hypothetical protein
VKIKLESSDKNDFEYDEHQDSHDEENPEDPKKGKKFSRKKKKVLALAFRVWKKFLLFFFVLLINEPMFGFYLGTLS